MSTWAYASGKITFAIRHAEVKGNITTMTNWTPDHIRFIVDEILRKERNRMLYKNENEPIENHLHHLPVDCLDCNLTWTIGNFYNRRVWRQHVRLEDRILDDLWYSVEKFTLYLEITRRGSMFDGVSRIIKRIISRLKKCSIEVLDYHLIIEGLPYGVLMVDSDYGIKDMSNDIYRTPARYKNA